MAFLPYLVNVTARFAPTVLSFEERSICASVRPLDNLQIVFGAQSCATRLVLKASARLAGAKRAALGTFERSSLRCGRALPAPLHG
ncbi:MAG: hypothetical protein J6U17_05415, partial [Kiritimatiellae bacterium]|nr:hypothetical protein [Kiritimatiellia bacterium]